MNHTFVVRFIGEEGETFVVAELTCVVAHTSPTRRTPLRRRNSEINLCLRPLAPSVTSFPTLAFLLVSCLAARVHIGKFTIELHI